MNNSVLTCVIGMLLSACVLTGCGRAKRADSASPNERTLFSFERSTMLAIYGGTASRALASEHATHGRRSLKVQLSPKHETLILSSGGFPMDWRGWRTLKADMYRVGPPLSLNLRFSDARGRRYWIWSVALASGANTPTIDISSLRGHIDLSAVTEIMCYAEQPNGAIYLDNVRLSR